MQIRLQNAELNQQPTNSTSTNGSNSTNTTTDNVNNTVTVIQSSEADRQKIDELTLALDEQKELASNRLNQLHELTERNIKVQQNIEKLKCEVIIALMFQKLYIYKKVIFSFLSFPNRW